MAVFDATQADNYGSAGGAGFFSLKNDKDTALVRFMYNDYDDIEGHSVHEIMVGDKRRYVNCLRAYDEPISECPLCADNRRTIVKLFLLLYDVDDGEVKIWDRGRTFFAKMSSLSDRYNPLVATEFEIERNGKKGDTKTTYEIYAATTDDTTLEDLPEPPQVLGGLVLDKTYDELMFYLNNGYFEEETDVPEARNPRSDRARAQGEEPVSRRRAPANEEPVRRRRTPSNQDRF